MKLRLSSIVSLTLCMVAQGQTVVYVDADLNQPCPPNCGDSWATAFDELPAAVAHAVTTGADEIWVAEGTYGGGFSLVNHLKIIGGFTGVETSSTQAQPGVNLTTIDGNFQIAITSQGQDSTAWLQAAYDGHRPSVWNECVDVGPCPHSINSRNRVPSRGL